MLRTNYSSEVFIGSLPGLITFDTLITTFFVYNYIIGPPFQMFGCVSNIINMVVFAKTGIQDSMTWSFFVLSASDLAFSSTLFVETVCIGLGFQGIERPVHVYGLSGYLSWYRSTFLDMSMLTTVYIAIVRCCCVALPFTSRSWFTVTRTLRTLAAMTLACVAVRIPQLSSTGLAWQAEPASNKSVLRVWYSASFNTINSVVSFVDRTVLPLAVLAIVSVCTVILTRALVRASKYRKQMTQGQAYAKNIISGTEKSSEQERKATQNLTKIQDEFQKHSTKFQESASGNKDSDQLSEKDARLVKTVMLVTILLLISSFIMSVNGLAIALVPEYYGGRRYGAMYSLILCIQHMGNLLNANVNIFIYWKLNVKFRTCFRKLFSKSET